MVKYFCKKCNRITSETKDYNVITNKPCAICGQIAIPSTLFHKIETKERIKNKGKIWVIHQNDDDNMFGLRHAHDYDEKRVLNLETGEIFDKITKQKVRKIKEKELQEIKSKSRFFKDNIFAT